MNGVVSEKISEHVTLRKRNSSRQFEYFLFTVLDIDDIWNSEKSDEVGNKWPKTDYKKIKKFMSSNFNIYQRPFSLLGVPQNGIVKSCKPNLFISDMYIDNHALCMNYPRNRYSRFGSKNIPQITESPILITHFERSRMNVIVYTNKITLVNRELIWVPHGQVRVIKLDLSLTIPDGLFGILTGTTNEPFCECMTELIIDETNISISLINLANESIMLLPGNIELMINFLPCYVPEPWEIFNFLPPNLILYSLITSKDFDVDANSYAIQNFDNMFICHDELKALIIANKDMTRSGLLVETNIWLKNTVPCVKIFNPTLRKQKISAGVCIAYVVFTCGHFILKILPNHAVNQLMVLDTTTFFLFQYLKE
ncbi:deoxyuridine triphosphatase [macacine betaherpesvirus 9]|uniref:Deoxyuridine triphosphatase n=1 Tax=macacine betaherpesvirus 9 TaxID=2560568 RepID=A0A192XNZ3_9BETA|nr:deoxyuridine triphosphatase [macacine betaherpesvirus 9]ANC96556.1 deoxyuridine triphosphatase [macacine betaherpesvirus 9]